MPNLYEDTASGAPATPPLEGEARADVVVVGGGITGLSTALHLAEKGVAVTVLEAQDAGLGCVRTQRGPSQSGIEA